MNNRGFLKKKKKKEGNKKKKKKEGNKKKKNTQEAQEGLYRSIGFMITSCSFFHATADMFSSTKQKEVY